jgi:5-formyltetrahydrofolate cyclo-ligase
MTDAEREVRSSLLAARVRALPEWRAASAVSLFVPTRREPDIRLLFDAAWREGKAVLVPRVNGDGETMALHRVSGWRDLQPGAWTVHEPHPDAPQAAPASADLILVPGLGFDAGCFRIGRGKGHYDRLLGAPGVRARTLGIFFDCQEAEVLPREPWDRRLDGVATESRLLAWTRA